MVVCVKQSIMFSSEKYIFFEIDILGNSILYFL